MGQRVQLGDGRTVGIRRLGPATGLPTVLTHMWALPSAWTYSGLTDSARHRYVLVDLPGHGVAGNTDVRVDSLEEHAEAVLHALELTGTHEFNVGGFSLGGAVAQLVARRAPHRVRGLILAASTTDWASRGRRGPWRAMPVMERFTAAKWPAPPWRAIARSAGAHKCQVNDLSADLATQSARAVFSTGAAMAHFDSRPWIHELRTFPSISILTELDRRIPAQAQAELGDALDARRIRLDVGHDAVLRQPRVLADAIELAVDLLALDNRR